MENNTVQPQNVQVPNYSGVNIQIFNPSVAAPGACVPASNVNATTYSTNPNPCYPPNYYTQNLAQPAPIPEPVKPQEPEKKKTEKREVVELTDDYIKTLEDYLNNQDKSIRLMGAKEVLARLQEDDSRKNDPALVALTNKMLQDPSQPVRLFAMSALDAGMVLPDDYTVKLLQGMQSQNGSTAEGRMKGVSSVKNEDAITASNVLLKTAGHKTEKEFEVKETKEKAEKEK